MKTAAQLNASAERVVRDLYDQAIKIYFTSDFGAFERLLLLPYEHTTREGSVILQTQADLRMLFDGVSAYMRMLGLDEVVVDVKRAEFQGPHRLYGCSELRFLSKGVDIVPPYTLVAEAVLSGAGWQVTSANHGIDPADAGINDVLMPPAFPTEANDRSEV